MITVLFEDSWLLVVHKPPGLATQADHGDDLYARVVARWPQAALHHRLDQPASGLVLFGLHPRVNAPITEALRRHEISRSYQAVLAGAPSAVPPEVVTTWSTPVDGATARTDVTRVGARRGMLAVRCALHTGRYHQIRQHAAGHGAPVVGDRRYGGESSSWHPRLALHACTLGWTHPVTGAPLVVHDPLPADLMDLWAMAGGS